MLKDAAIAWVRANCTDPKLRADFARQLKDLMLRRIDCSFAVGPALTRGWVPYMIQCFAGEMFIFLHATGEVAEPNGIGKPSQNLDWTDDPPSQVDRDEG